MTPDAAEPDIDAVVLGAFGAPVAIAELNTVDREEDPSLTSDQLEIFFISSRAGGAGLDDIWTATRTTSTGTWSVPQPVVQINSATTELHPHVAPDGLTMYLASDRAGGAGGLDIYFTTRANRTAPWTTPTRVVELSSTANDFSAAPDSTDLVLVLDSDRGGATLKDIYISTRINPQALWRGPTAVALLNSANNDQDGVFADGGKAVYFATGLAGAFDLVVATRPSIGVTFGVATPITELNSPQSDLDPWISEDQRTLYFNSTRAGAAEDLYFSTR